jgi:hypothetical protein
MVHSSSSLRFGSVVMALAGLALAGCAAHAAPPPGVPVHGFVANSLTLRGTAEPTLTSATCSAAAPTSPKHVVELPEETRATIFLGPEKGQPLLPVSMLHMTHLDSNRTWCVMTKADGTPAALVGEFPSGVYAIAVAESKSAAPQRYEVTFEKL